MNIRHHTIQQYTLGGANGQRGVEFPYHQGLARRLRVRATVTLDATSDADLTTQDIWDHFNFTLRYHSGPPMFNGLTGEDWCCWEAHQNGRDIPVATSDFTNSEFTFTQDFIFSFIDERKGPNCNDFAPRCGELNELIIRVTDASQPGAAPAIGALVDDIEITVFLETDESSPVIGLRRELWKDTEDDPHNDLGGNNDLITDILMIGRYIETSNNAGDGHFEFGTVPLFNVKHRGDWVKISGDMPTEADIAASAMIGYGAPDQDQHLFYIPLVWQRAYYSNTKILTGSYSIDYSENPDRQIPHLIVAFQPATRDNLKQRFPKLFSSEDTAKIVEFIKPMPMVNSNILMLSPAAQPKVPLVFKPPVGASSVEYGKVADMLGAITPTSFNVPLNLYAQGFQPK